MVHRSAYFQRFTKRFPLGSYLLKQILFWVIANSCLAIIMHLYGLANDYNYGQHLQKRMLLPSLMLGLIVGIFFGSTLGLTDYLFDKKNIRGWSLGKIILLKAALSLVLFFILFSLFRFVLFRVVYLPNVVEQQLLLNEKTSRISLYFFLFYYFLAGIIIAFFNQVNHKFGPGVTLPLFLGRYRNPKEEERAFMFMDLKSSTSIAEKLGHIRYSSFIRDSFMDINYGLSTYSARVYQYVGDEIVLTWSVKEGLENLQCINFFFACEQRFNEKKDYYNQTYGIVPSFKAGLHFGKVTAVEIGDVKRDIAYHGDTVNTAARIQHMCNEYGKTLLVSEYFLSRITLSKNYSVQSLGEIILKGKANPVGIASVEYV
jgi:adenylate cyclase